VLVPENCRRNIRYFVNCPKQISDFNCHLICPLRGTPSREPCGSTPRFRDNLGTPHQHVLRGARLDFLRSLAVSTASSNNNTRSCRTTRTGTCGEVAAVAVGNWNAKANNRASNDCNPKQAAQNALTAAFEVSMSPPCLESPRLEGMCAVYKSIGFSRY
jgi:hypothetical protein